jgi:hypothetical protein
MLDHASIAFFGFEARGTGDHILLSQVRDSPSLEGQVSYIYFPARTSYLSYAPRHWVPFRKVKVMLQPTVSRPHSLGARHPSGTRHQFFVLIARLMLAEQHDICCLASSDAEMDYFLHLNPSHTTYWLLTWCFSTLNKRWNNITWNWENKVKYSCHIIL